MGHIGNIAHPDVQALIEHGRANGAARPASPSASSGPNPDMVRRFIDYGYDYVAIGSDLAMMTSRASEWLAALRQSTAPAPAPAAY